VVHGNVGAPARHVKQRFAGDLPFAVVSVELRHLRAFVAVAEELNFTRAAARLHLAQQALSAQIRQLEALLGTPLFVRTTRRVELTGAGRALLERAPALLANVEEALDSAVTAGRGETGELTVGLLATASLDFTPRLLRAFAEELPEVSVSVRNFSFDDPSGGVRSGQADVALVWLPFADEGLACERLFDDARVAVLAADHPLAERPELTVEDLLDEPFGWIDDLDPVARDFWTLGDRRGGEPPRIGAHITGFDDLFAAVRAWSVVAASPASVVTVLPFTDLVTRPVRDLEPAGFAVCRRANDPNPVAERFVKAAVALSRRVRGESPA
jgi:DNA-binding transcriptional LysR family regulator